VFLISFSKNFQKEFKKRLFYVIKRIKFAVRKTVAEGILIK